MKYHTGFAGCAFGHALKIRQFVIATQRAKGLVAGLLAVLLAACASESSLRSYVPQIVTPYRIDIQQGNFITPDMLQKLAVGQTREQVRFILGTPLLVDIFRANRWDYVFRSSKGWNEPEKRKLIVFFDASGRVERWEADLPPPAPAVPAQPAAQPQPKAQAPAAVPAPVQAVSGRANLTVETATPAVSVAQTPGTNPAEAGVPPFVPGTVSRAAPDPAAAEPGKATAPEAPVATTVPLPAAAAPVVMASAAPQGLAPAAPAMAGALAPPATAVAATAAPTPAATSSAILSALEEWRAAWARRDVDRYLSMYAADFTPPAGLTRAQWEEQRRLRLQRASFIVVKLIEPQIRVAGDSQATAVFTQVYESDALKESGRKTLALVQADGRWRIRDESFRK